MIVVASKFVGSYSSGWKRIAAAERAVAAAFVAFAAVAVVAALQPAYCCYSYEAYDQIETSSLAS